MDKDIINQAIKEMEEAKQVTLSESRKAVIDRLISDFYKLIEGMGMKEDYLALPVGEEQELQEIKRKTLDAIDGHFDEWWLLSPSADSYTNKEECRIAFRHGFFSAIADDVIREVHENPR